MIDLLQGELVFKSPGAATVRTAGVGFRLHVSLATYESLPRIGAEVRLLTYLHVRKDELSLYGFATEVERQLFRMLLGVSQIGPMVALRILSGCSPAQLKRYILDEDIDALKSMVKGIGAKTARRLVAELHGPVQELAVAPWEGPAGQVARDAIAALVALGEARAAAEKAVNAAVKKLGTEADSQSLVEEALSH